MCGIISEMKFGKSLRTLIAEASPEYRDNYISYKDLKKQLKLIVNQINVCDTHDSCFIQLLHNNLEKVECFLLEKEEEYVIRLDDLKNRLANLDYGGDVTGAQRDLVEFHGELVLLLQYNNLNMQVLLKIAKKHKKKTGNSVRLQDPLFTTDLLHNFLRECDVMLNQLFIP